MAVPVIASAVGGIVEIFSDGKEGFLVPPNDPEALAEKITLLVKNPQLCHEMGNLGRVTYLSRFEQSKVLADQADWLEKITRA